MKYDAKTKVYAFMNAPWHTQMALGRKFGMVVLEGESDADAFTRWMGLLRESNKLDEFFAEVPSKEPIQPVPAPDRSEGLRVAFDKWPSQAYGRESISRPAFEAGWRTALAATAQVTGENGLESLRGHLKWALDYIGDGAGKDQTPEHACDFLLNPEKGHCEFHEKYWSARKALGLAARIPDDSLRERIEKLPRYFPSAQASATMLEGPNAEWLNRGHVLSALAARSEKGKL